MAFVYLPPQSQPYRIGYYDNLIGTTKSISAKTWDKRVAKKICRYFAAQLRLKMEDKDLLLLPGSNIKLSKAFKQYVISSGLNPKLKFHSLRHTFASWLVQRGVSIYEVSKLLGHSDIKTTEIYSHLRADDLRTVVDMLN